MKPEIFFFDKDNKITDKDNADRFIFRKTDENGNILEESFGYINQDDDPRYVMSQEQYDYLVSVGQKPDMTKFRVR